MAETSPCGTYAGVQRHIRLGEPACDACRIARRDYMREYRRRRAVMILAEVRRQSSTVRRDT